MVITSYLFGLKNEHHSCPKQWRMLPLSSTVSVLHSNQLTFAAFINRQRLAHKLRGISYNRVQNDYAGLLLFFRCAELVIGTKPPPYLPHGPCTTHIKERRKPVSEDQGYGTHEVANLVPSDDESEGASDEELEAVGDAPVCLTAELQVRKEGVQETVESTQQPAASSFTGPNTPHSPPHSTSPSTTFDKLTSLPAPANKPTFSPDNLAPPNSSAEHRLELLGLLLCLPAVLPSNSHYRGM